MIASRLRRALLIVAAELSLALAATAAPLTVQVRVADAKVGDPPVPVAITVLSTAQVEPPAEPRTGTIQAPGTEMFEVAAGQVWVVRAAATGWWSEPSSVFVADAGAAATVTVWPVGTVAGKVTVKEADPPTAISVRFEPVADPEQAGTTGPAGTVTCPIAAGAFRCELPAGRFHLALHAAGFITHYRWAAKVPRGRDLDVGALALRPGSTVVGFVAAEDGAVDPKTCEIALHPAVADRSMPDRTADRAAATIPKVHPNAWGAFVFDGVPAGDVYVLATQPGYATSTLGPVRVPHADELRLDEPVVLQRPLTLEVVVTPPLDGAQKPWKVSVLAIPAAGDIEKVVDAQGVDADGRVTKPGLSPGHYYVMLMDSAGRRTANRSVELNRDTPPVEFALDLVALRGTVKLGDEPLAAGLVFREPTRREVAISLRSDAEGTFTGVLPHDGEWTVDVTADDPPVSRTVRRVDVSPGGERHEAEVAIRLPDTTIEGRVVDRDGRPVSGAAVDLVDVSNAAPARRMSRDDGSFRFVGVDDGLHQLEAADGTREGRRKSDVVQVEVEDGESPPPVTLVLKPEHQLRGTVVTPEGVPLLGAHLSVLPDPTQGYLPQWVADATTPVDGSFAVDVPEGPAWFDVLLMPPGFAVTVIRLHPDPPGDGERVVAESGGGTVTIVTDGDANWREPDAPHALLWRNGRLIADPSLFLMWPRSNGGSGLENGRLSIPMMSPAVYRACLAPLPTLMAVAAGAPLPPDARCATGSLGVGGEVVLDLRTSDGGR